MSIFLNLTPLYMTSRVSSKKNRFRELCEGLNYSKDSSISVRDQLEEVYDELNEEDMTLSFEKVFGSKNVLETARNIVPKNAKECYDWGSRVITTNYRGEFIEIFENELNGGCESCGIDELSCVQNPTPEIKELLVDEISFDIFNSVNENCKDARPNWCNNAKSNQLKRLKKMCKKEGGKVKEIFCCETCLSLNK